MYLNWSNDNPGTHENEMSTYLQELLKGSNTMAHDTWECLSLNLSHLHGQLSFPYSIVDQQHITVNQMEV